MQDLVRYGDILPEFRDVIEAVDRAFAELGFPAAVPGARSLIDRGVAPDLRVAHEGNRYRIGMDLPGLRHEGLAVECTGDTVTVSGEWPEPKVGSHRPWRLQRPRGRFVRSLRLKEPIDASTVHARLAHGVLTVELAPAAFSGTTVPVREGR